MNSGNTRNQDRVGIRVVFWVFRFFSRKLRSNPKWPELEIVSKLKEFTLEKLLESKDAVFYRSHGTFVQNLDT